MSNVADRFDVLVVGCGIAGLSAAVAALEAGARVGIVERAPREERGGNTRWTEAFWRMQSADMVAHDFESHFMANAGHYLDPDLVRETARDYAQWPAIVKAMSFSDPEVIATFGKAAGPTLRWLEGFGLRFDFLPSYLITQCTTRMAPVGGGLQLVETLAGEAERRGASFFYQTTAHELLRDEEGAVAGVKVRHRDGRWHDWRAAAVVLASGGFEGNPEMLARYVGPNARYTRPVARGGHYNKGEGIRMALALNAAPNGDYSDFHAEPIDPRSGKGEPIVFVFPYGVLVNRRGERFVDEASATVDAIYEKVTRRINEQPQGIAYVILDAKLDEVPNWQRTVRSDQPAIVADGMVELAGKLDLPADRLRTTVAAYNAACRPGMFKPLELDGLATQGLDPVKSNWARPLDRPPYRAWPIIAANCFTFGGLKTDASARVLDLDGEPIAGLYAAGETMGLYFGTYTGATSVMRGAVFGRIAGQDGARRAAGLRQAR
ncbi:MAG: FAD-dependent oxidoreductase [Alphaproteobacteria bacterium]|nr:FAD-dependent oxidoreductase [Alphaproteobacteria bacterium]